MKNVLFALTILASATSFAKDLNCSGKALSEGKMQTVYVKTDGKNLLVGEAFDDGSGSSFSSMPLTEVQRWSEGGVKAFGFVNFESKLKIYPISETELTLARNAGWGTPEDQIVLMTCR